MNLTATESATQGKIAERPNLEGFARRIDEALRGQARWLSGLLLSTALAEVASNVAYVVLVEQAYRLGRGSSAIGIVLLLQAAAQVLFGSGAGSIADRWGFRKAAMLPALLTIPLLAVLFLAQHVLVVYAVAFLLMAAKLVLIPARFGLVAHLSDKSRMAQANAALLILAGAGSFVGPGVAAALLLIGKNFALPLLVAAAGWLLSIASLVAIRERPGPAHVEGQLSFYTELQTGWRLIRKRATISQLLICLLLVAFILAAITPLLTPLSRQLGLASEGTGVLFSALGFGYLVGPLIASGLFKRMRLSTALLIAGLLAPLGLVLIGALEALAGVLVAIAFVSASGAAVNVMVTTITQRLTPADHQGSVLGTQQALLGLAWMMALGVTSLVAAVWDAESIAQLLFLILGSVGLVSVLSCWLWNKRAIQAACALCQPRFVLSKLICWGLQGIPMEASRSVCSLICGKKCQCCFE